MFKPNRLYLSYILLLLCLLPQFVFSGVKIKNSSAEQDDLDGTDPWFLIRVLVEIETSSALSIQNFQATIQSTDNFNYPILSADYHLLDPIYVQFPVPQIILATNPPLVTQSAASPSGSIYFRIDLEIDPLNVPPNYANSGPKIIDFTFSGDELDPITFNTIAPFSVSGTVTTGVNGGGGVIGGGWGGGNSGGVISPFKFRKTQASSEIQSANVYPNPLTDRSVLSLNLIEEGPLQIKVYAIDGKLLKVLTPERNFAAGRHEIPLQLPDLSKGRYFLKIKTKSMEETIPIIQ